MLKRTGSAFSVAVAMSLMFGGSGLAQAADNWLGTWKLNVAKSKYSAGPAPRSGTATYSAWEDGVRAVTEGVGADFGQSRVEYAAKFDGKDYPSKGSSFQVVSLTRIDDDTFEVSFKSRGKVMVVARSVVSKDGKTRTQTATGTTFEGKPFTNTLVFDRQ